VPDPPSGVQFGPSGVWSYDVEEEPRPKDRTAGRATFRMTTTTVMITLVRAMVRMPHGSSSHQDELSDTGGTVADAAAWNT
jgi:hypothetical protein